MTPSKSADGTNANSTHRACRFQGITGAIVRAGAGASSRGQRSIEAALAAMVTRKSTNKAVHSRDWRDKGSALSTTKG